MKIINCEGLSKVYKDKVALKDITFSVNGTGCVGFLGANGAGKTTTIRILAGLAKPTSGKVEVVGLDVNSNSKKIREVSGYCPQIPTFYDYMTATEWMYWVGGMFDLDKETIKRRNEELLKMCGIWEAKDRKIGGFSGGMKQRLAIAQALINEPKLLILFKGGAVYLPNLLLVIAILLFLSSFLNKQLAVAAGTIILYNILVIVPKYLGSFVSSIAPSGVVASANKILSGIPDVEFVKPVICVTILALVFIVAGWTIFKNQEI